MFQKDKLAEKSTKELMNDYSLYNQRLWLNKSEIYDFFMTINTIGYLPLVIHRTMTEMIELSDDKRVLDLCTGTGGQLRSIGVVCREKRVKPFVVALDMSLEMMQKARIKAEKKRLSVDFVQSDATMTSFRDESFDVVCCSLALHDMPLDLIEKVIHEVHRILKKGGMFISLEISKPEYSKLIQFLMSLHLMFDSYYSMKNWTINFGEFLAERGFVNVTRRVMGFRTFQLVRAFKAK